MNIITKKINNENVKIIPVPKVTPSQIKGYNVIPMLKANIFVCGQKGTGKTNVDFKIIESCITNETKVIVFCSTHDNDVAWKFIKKYFEKNNIQAMFFSSLFENNIDQLESIFEFMRQEGKEEEEQKKQKISEKIEIIRYHNNTNTSKVKIKKNKKKIPKYLFIFDDLSIELKKKNLVQLLKTFRHYNAKVIVSSQFLNDLDPQERQQMDIWILFKNHPKERLEKIYPDIGCNINFELFYEIYFTVTQSAPYQFLFVNKNTCELRKNFNEEILIK